MSGLLTPHLIVQAAAGTGKTRLLTSRILRLLLAQVPPSGILAITFTRKAAGEIHLRVIERLRAMAEADPASLTRQLAELEVNAAAPSLQAARALYERFLATEYPMRITTFHGFCQEILRRFPYEAEINPGFGLLENTAELEAAAWRALQIEITGNTRTPLAAALDVLLQTLGGVANTRQALNDFLNHRSDWWAYTENHPDPAAFACGQLRKTLHLSNNEDPIAAFIAAPGLKQELQQYSDLLNRHPIQTHLTFIQQLAVAALQETPPPEKYRLIYSVFMTNSGEARQLNRKIMSQLEPPARDKLIALHEKITERLRAAQDAERKRQTFHISAAWYACGQRLLQHYQRLKSEKNLLDFTDLEWRAYRLLNRSHHAEWIQYKLDQRIDHLLVDEFQDTNPTQWRLLLPLLQEMAAGNPERQRSVFLVGDEKQSIYRFRRADARLFSHVRAWLEENLQADTLNQHISWRSSPAIIQFINLVFDAQADDTQPLLPDFRKHDTYRQELWGHAELLPLIPQQPSLSINNAVKDLRDPLLHPRELQEDERYRREGELIAQKIKSLVGKFSVGEGDDARPLDYGDMLILLRDRAYAQLYEQALRRAGLPYTGVGRGGLLESLEIRDLMHLLRLFISPDDDLALASALKSPIFACTDMEVMRLAEIAQDQAMETSWLKHLQQLDLDPSSDANLARAQYLLNQWISLVDRIPVHDLLDRIFNEGNIIERYVSAAPEHLKLRVEFNLNHLLALSLETNSGRYPSLSHFLSQLEITGNNEEAFTTPARSDQQQIRLMTIHGAKGLESPVVFLADAARDFKRDKGWRALIHWPVNAERPYNFHLTGKKEDQDPVSRKLINEQGAAADQEEINLLYVALTRAKQMLFISGCEPARKNRGWYGLIEQRVRAAADNIAGIEIQHIYDKDGKIVNTHGNLKYGLPRVVETAEKKPSLEEVTIDPALTVPLPIENDVYTRYSPSQTYESGRQDGSPDAQSSPQAQQRGIVIHRILQLLTGKKDRTAIWQQVQSDWSGVSAKEDLKSYWMEACRVVDHAAFRSLFDSSTYDRAYNEMPILYRQGTHDIYGIVDRLVSNKERLILVDYKTHAQATPENIAELAANYVEQMRLYAAGIRKLWPEKHLQALLLFTACRASVEVPLAGC